MLKGRILYILTRYPFPIITGRHKMLDQNIRVLSESYSVDILYFSHHKVSLIEAYGKVQEQLRLPSLVRVAWNLIIRRNYSLQEDLFYSPSASTQIDKKIDKGNYSFVICDMLRTAQYLEKHKVKKVIDIDDLLSLRYKRALLRKDLDFKLFGSLQSRYLRLVEKLTLPITKFILSKEVKLVERRENILMENFNVTFFVSNTEAQLVNSNKTFYVPPMVNKKNNEYSSQNLKDINFIFLGNFTTNQNKASLKFIIQEIIPKLNDSIENFTFYLVGRGDKDVMKMIDDSKSNNIEFLGFVEDMEVLLRKITIAIMPIAFGSGIKTKILDLMSFGIPVVTNSTGIEGISVSNDVHLISRESADEIHAEIIELLSQPNKLFELSIRGHQFVNQNFNKDMIREKLNEILVFANR